MKKEDFKLICSVVLFVLYLFTGLACAYATGEVTREAGFNGFLVGGTITVLLIIPACYILEHNIYEQNKDFFDNLFK